MNRFLIPILSLLTALLFLGIRTRYQMEPSTSLLHFIYIDILNLEKINFHELNYFESWSIVSLEMFLGVVFLILTSLLNKRYWTIISSLTIFYIWLKNYIVYKGIMDSDYYLISSVYFIMSLILLNVFNLILRKKERTSNN